MRLRTLGRLELEGSEFKRPKPLSLLAFLAIEGPQERGYLADLFWMGASDTRNRLSGALARLRTAGPNVVEADETRVWTTLGCDAVNLRAALDGGDLEVARRLYQGPFLEGLRLDVGVELEEWIYATRELLAERMRAGLLDAGRREARRGRFDVAAGHAETAVRLRGAPELEPDDLATVHRLLLAGGSPLARTVREEAEGYGLQVATSPEAARDALRTDGGDEGATAPPLPADATPFVGREAERRRASEQLRDPACRLLTVTAPGGMGKTRLALAVTRELADAFRDGARFVPLDLTPTPEQMTYAVAAAVDCVLQGDDAPERQLRAFLRDRELLLVLDNMEHLLDAVEEVSAILEAAPGVKVLATSRERLHSRYEWVFDLQGLALPEADGSGDPGTADAVTLFTQCARRAGVDLRLDEDTLPHVVRVCRLVGGMPLAIELATSWLRALPLPEIAAEIARGTGLLEAATRDVPPRQRSIRAVFDASRVLLRPDDREALERLAIFPGDFDRAAAREVAGMELATLARLVDASFVALGGGGRYRMHPLVRQYLAERLADRPDERRALEARYDAHYLTLLDRLVAEVRGGRQKEAFAAIDLDLDNFRAVWRRALANVEAPLLSRLALAIETYYVQRHRAREGVDVLQGAIDVLDAERPEHQGVLGDLLVKQGWLHLRLGRYDEAAAAVDRGLPLLRAAGDARGVMEGLNLQGSIAGLTSRFDLSKERFEEALALAREAGSDAMIARYTNNLAIAERERGAYGRAEELYRSSIALNRALGQQVALVRNLNNLGYMLLETGRPDEAEALLEEGLSRAREAGFMQLVAYLLTNHGSLALVRGDRARARACLEEALTLARESGDRGAEAEVLRQLGVTDLEDGDLDGAARRLRAALGAARTLGSVRKTLWTLIAFARLERRRGRPGAGASLLARVVEHPAADALLRQRAAGLARDLEGAPGGEGGDASDVAGDPAVRAGPRSLDEAVAALLAGGPDG